MNTNTKISLDQVSLDILSKVGIDLINNNPIANNIVILRDTLLNDQLYESIKPTLLDLKHSISSTKHNCLHKNANESQRWPLINLVRQILHHYGFKMEPFRKCVTKNGVKIYTRYFRVLHDTTFTNL